jgi:hypothetical protein
MTLPQRIREIQRTWEDSPRPFENFRARRGDALTYGIECDLDHQADYILSLLRALEAKSPHWDFAMRATNELRELHELRERLEALELPQQVAAPLLRYTDTTDQLLRAIVDEVSPAQQ